MRCNYNLLKAGFSLGLKCDRAWNTPLHLQVEPTSNCNLRCKFCSREVGPENNHQLVFADFKKIFDQVNPLRVTWAGRGEPLLSDNLVPMLRYAKQRGAQTVVTTNFTLGKRLAQELVEVRVNNLRISIDTADAQIYKSLRGRDLHGQILDGIIEINRLKLEQGAENPKLSFEIVLTKENLANGEGIISLANKYNISRVNFRPLGLVGILEDRQEKLLPELDYDRFLNRLKKWREFAELSQVRTNLDEFIGRFPFYWGRYTGKMEKRAGCVYLWLQGYINAEGEMTPCCALNMDEGVSMGNVLRDGFFNVWNGEQYKKFRQVTQNGEFLFQSCKQCVPKQLTRTIKRARFFN